MAYGPAELIVVKFPGNQFQGEIVPALADLVDSGTIRLIDLLFLLKDDGWHRHLPGGGRGLPGRPALGASSGRQTAASSPTRMSRTSHPSSSPVQQRCRRSSSSTSGRPASPRPSANADGELVVRRAHPGSRRRGGVPGGGRGLSFPGARSSGTSSTTTIGEPAKGVHDHARGRMGRPGLVGTMARTAVIAGTASAHHECGQRTRPAEGRGPAAGRQPSSSRQPTCRRRWADMQAQIAAQQAPAPAAAAPACDDVTAQLTQLKALVDQGILTQEEFDAKKKQLLGI